MLKHKEYTNKSDPKISCMHTIFTKSGYCKWLK